MKLFFAFLVLCFLGGLLALPAPTERRLGWFVAGLCLALFVGIYVFRKI